MRKNGGVNKNKTKFFTCMQTFNLNGCVNVHVFIIFVSLFRNQKLFNFFYGVAQNWS